MAKFFSIFFSIFFLTLCFWYSFKYKLNKFKSSILGNFFFVKNRIEIDFIKQKKNFIQTKRVDWIRKSQYENPKYKGTFLTINEKGGYCINKVNSNLNIEIFKNTSFIYNESEFLVEDIILNPLKKIDNLKNIDILIVTNSEKQKNKKIISLYWIYKKKENQIKPIQPLEKCYEDENNLCKINFAYYSPLGDQIIFGYKQNLYIENIALEKVKQITKNKEEFIFNGMTDWVYEEDVLIDNKLFWWSPDQKNLIYAKIDNNYTFDYHIDYLIKKDTNLSESNPLNNKSNFYYPTIYNIKYPLTGTNIPRISIFNYLFYENKNYRLEDTIFNLNEYILYSGQWIDKDTFLIDVTDRTSKILMKSVYEPYKNYTKITIVEKKNYLSKYNGWFDKKPYVYVIKDNNVTYYIDFVISNNRNHLALFTFPIKGQHYKLLTNSMNWDVLTESPIAYDSQKKLLYFTVNIKSSMDSHLVSLNLSSNDFKMSIITDINKDAYYTSYFSDDGRFLNLNYKGPELPFQILIDMHDYYLFTNHSKYSSLNEYLKNKKMTNLLESYKNQIANVILPKKNYKSICIQPSICLDYIEITPPYFDSSGIKKYPVVVYVYGAPGTKSTKKIFTTDIDEFLSTQLNSIVLIIDPRGTSNNGILYMFSVIQKIGFFEPRDIVFVTSKYLSHNALFVNLEKIFLWGWSYGGYITLKTLEYDAGKTFKYGLAISPVTNWLLYNLIYTERYMGLPSFNYQNYFRSRINNLSNLKFIKKFALIHGSSDDNVHIQNTLWLLDKLNFLEIDNYDFFLYPDNDHSLDYHNHYFIYKKIFVWFKKNLR